MTLVEIPWRASWGWCACLSLLAGCLGHTSTTVDPGEGCFAAHGLEAPEWVEGEALGPGVPVWCLPLPHLPSAPEPRRVGPCQIEVFSAGGEQGAEERIRYDAQGRWVEWLVEGRRHTRRYEGSTLREHSQTWDERLERQWIYNQNGQIVEHEEHFPRDGIDKRSQFIWINGSLVESKSTRYDRDGKEVRTHIIRVHHDTGAPSESIQIDENGEVERYSQTSFDELTGDFVTTSGVGDERTESRGRCTPEGRWIDLWGEVRVASSGQQIQRVWPEGRSMVVYDGAGRRARSYIEHVGEVEVDAGFVYDPSGRLLCSQELYWDGMFDWPPLREYVPGACLGSCGGFKGAISLPPGPIKARAQMQYDEQGHLLEMALDVGADGSIEQVLEFDVGYDDQGRLIHEGWLGAWSLMRAEYTYDCPAE